MHEISRANLAKGLALIESFERGKAADRRIALIGLTLFLLAATALVSYFEFTSGPDRYLSAKILSLDEISESGPASNKSYIALVELSSGVNVLARVEPSLFSRLSSQQRVEVGYFEDEERYEVVDRWDKVAR